MGCKALTQSIDMQHVQKNYRSWLTQGVAGHSNTFLVHFRSTPPSGPNEASLKCPSARPSVRPQNVLFDFNEIWCVGSGRRAMHDGMQYDPIKVKVTSP